KQPVLSRFLETPFLAYLDARERTASHFPWPLRFAPDLGQSRLLILYAPLTRLVTLSGFGSKQKSMGSRVSFLHHRRVDASTAVSRMAVYLALILASQHGSRAQSRVRRG